MCELLEREWREGMEEGLLKGRKEGELFCLINQTVKKRNRGMMAEEIAVMIERILLAAAEAGLDEVEAIYDYL